MRSVFRQLIEKQAVAPYIMGHVTDGSSTFTFNVNESTPVTVSVGADGWWKWYADRTVTSFKSAFYFKKNISYVEICGFKDFTDCYFMFNADQNATESNLETVRFINCDFSKVTDEHRMFRGRAGLKEIIGLDKTKHSLNTTLNTTFQSCELLKLSEDFRWENLICSNVTNFTGTFMNCYNIDKVDISNSGIPNTIYYICSGAKKIKTLYLPNIPSDCNVTGFMGGAPVQNFEINDVKIGLNLAGSAVLTKQSILNLINATTASVTHTLYSAVYNKCASGGEWNTDVQAAIDAKALEGYTVTLISA